MTMAGFRQVPAHIISRFARAIVRGYQAVKIIASRETKDRGKATRAETVSRKGGGREEKTVPRIRMASYVSYKRKIVLPPFSVYGGE